MVQEVGLSMKYRTMKIVGDVPGADAKAPRAPFAWRVLESGRVPDAVVRAAIRRLLRQRLSQEDKGSPELQQAHFMALLDRLKASPIALQTNAANSQHYEIPAEFYRLCLGPQLKYSCAYWPAGVRTLTEAEQAMLDLTAKRAQLSDGQHVLELGCGWGSLSLYLAKKYPRSRIFAVSNSSSQKEFIDAQAAAFGLRNLEIVTADINAFSPTQKFDRVVSVEMFEHLRNYETLLARIASWMNNAALLFVHIFSHTRFAYTFDVRDASDWMAQNFFTGGIMPSDDLLLYFQRDLKIQQHWRLSGTHYQKTAECWLSHLERNRADILDLFSETYASTLTEKSRQTEAFRWFIRWRVFFMSCAELWGYNGGMEWIVSHYLFAR